MATTAMPAPTNNSKYYMTGPSSPHAYAYVRPINTSTATATTNPNPAMPLTPPSAGVSPTNYHGPSNVRYIRPPRQPMCVPAALRPPEYAGRPTDIPNRPRAPDTPPTSKDNSFDSGNTASNLADGAHGTTSGTAVDASLEDLRRGLSHSATDSLDSDLGDVTGPPTNAHWKPDESARECAVCHQTFSWFFRRHHCRRCGDVVCGAHSTRAVPLDQNARFHPNGTRSKACDPCASEWRVVAQLRLSRTSSIAESMEGSRAGSIAAPARPIPSNHPRGGNDEMRIGSMARSEGGMIWSTF